jgi:tetratricopeptide (TPR) repeat protein
MGHNLEKNLRKTQALRARGQLDKALKQLQEWARRYPDTPHYLYEAAMVAFDMEDFGVGLTALKNLLRAIPNTKDRVLKACGQRFDDQPSLPLAEFLIEHNLADLRLDVAFDVASKLDPDQLQVFARKVTLRHRSLAATPNPGADTLRHSFHTQLAVAHALKSDEDFAESIEGLLELEGAQPEDLAKLCRSELETARHSARLRHALGRALCRAGKVAEGSATLVAACQHDRKSAPTALELIESLEPRDDERGRWLRAQGDLALLGDRGEVAARCYREAADADPSLRADLVRHLEQVPVPPRREDASALLKLRLRLLVVLGEYRGVPGLLDRLRAEELANDEELRGLLGEGQAARDARPTAMVSILAEAALHAGDLRSAVRHIGEIPDHDDHALHKVLRVLESRIPKPEAGETIELEWYALMAVLQSRIGDVEGANTTLQGLWTDRFEDSETLFAITRTCLERVAATPGLLAAYLPYALRQGQAEDARHMLEGILADSDQDVDDLVRELTDLLERSPDLSEPVLTLLDECDKSLGAAHLLRYPTALAAHLSQQYERSVPEFSVLLMTQPQLAPRVLEHMRAALAENPNHPQLNVAAHELLVEAEEFAEAGLCLSRALSADPALIQDVSTSFESLLKQCPDDVDLWTLYADSLFHAGRFDQLVGVCDQAAQHLSDDQMGEFRLLQARMAVEEGRLSDALDVLEREIRRGIRDSTAPIEVLRDIIAANPTSSRAHMLLGEACSQTGRVDEAIDAFSSAVRARPELASRIIEKFHDLAARPAVEGTHLLAMANFHRHNGNADDAADMYERAMKLQEKLADRVLGELGQALEHADVALTVLLVGARAARRAGQVERACELLARIGQREPRHFESLLSEYRKLGDAFPGDLLPIRHAARLLLAHNAPDAAAQIVIDTSRNDEYDVRERIRALREFYQGQPHDTRLALALARLLNRIDRTDEAATCVRAALERSDLDLEEAARVSRELRERAPDNPEVALIHHDVLLRFGQVDEALHALPEPVSLEVERLHEISDRFAAQVRRSLADPSLALRYAESLRRQDRRDDAITVLRTAADECVGDGVKRVQTELARLLHEADRTAEYREVVRELAENVDDRRRLYQLFESWCRTRLERETSSLRERLSRTPEEPDLVFELARKLLEQGRAVEVPAVVMRDFPSHEDRARRATVLARAYLDMDQVDMAEAVLLPYADRAVSAPDCSDEIQLYLAECAGRLGRWGESHARYLELLDSPVVGTAARAKARDAYAHYLADAAGEYCAVLSKVSALEPRRGNAEETT